MDYELNQEQQILKDAAHNFFLKECPSAFVRQMMEDEKGYTVDLWKKMAAQGWMGLLIPEAYGGTGGNFLDMAVLLYEAGYACLPGPFFSTAVLGSTALIDGGSEFQKKELLPQVSKGDRILTVAWTEGQGTYAPQAILTRAVLPKLFYLISGTKLFVPDAHVADTLICAVRTQEVPRDPEDGISLFLLPRQSVGIQSQLLKTMAGDKLCEVTFDRVQAHGKDLLGEVNRGWPLLKKVLLKAAVAKCAEMSGAGQKVLDMVIPQVKERIQFGKPIGSFQAVQYHCADILTFFETSKFMTFQAAWRISEGLSFAKEASMSKAWVSDAIRKAVALGHQVMGGMGFMEEHDLQLYFKRTKSAEWAFGNGDFHRELLAREMGL